MSRLTTLCLIAAIALLALPAFAQQDQSQSPADQVLESLRNHGYSILEQERTWLGRERVLAEKDGMHREVVFNPGTGEILRDYAIRIAAVLPENTGQTGTAAAISADLGPPASTAGEIPNRDLQSNDIDPGLSVGEPVGISVGESQ